MGSFSYLNNYIKSLIKYVINEKQGIIAKTMSVYMLAKMMTVLWK